MTQIRLFKKERREKKPLHAAHRWAELKEERFKARTYCQFNAPVFMRYYRGVKGVEHRWGMSDTHTFGSGPFFDWFVEEYEVVIRPATLYREAVRWLNNNGYRVRPAGLKRKPPQKRTGFADQPVALRDVDRDVKEGRS